MSAAEITAFDLVYQEKFRAEHGECRGCYLRWPEGTEGVPPRPQFNDDGYAGVLAAARGLPPFWKQNVWPRRTRLL